ncbi:transposase [Mycobacterium avium subsp. hominissuis]|uniref:Transposase n=1 Tax=Mycobacterium avium subsp. hominissuis TaxID=439334 RepID=A0AAI8SJ36_MYCAV|nr:transposase [Mycobacterium avium subsp. hominissuis]
MPKKYDEEFKARAVRLVSDHAEEYATRTACLTAVAKRLGVSYESLRRWINQAEVDTGVRDGAPTDTVRELRELKRKNRELEETIEILKAATSFFVRESDRDTVDLCVHRRASCSVRGRSDLPRAH